MITQNPVKIPDIPGKITIMKKDDAVYVRYLAGRNYDPEKKYNKPEWIVIGRRIEAMPGLMYPNDNYEKLFCEGEDRMEENLAAEEEQYIRDNGVYGVYNAFFTGL